MLKKIGLICAIVLSTSIATAADTYLVFKGATSVEFNPKTNEFISKGTYGQNFKIQPIYVFEYQKKKYLVVKTIGSKSFRVGVSYTYDIIPAWHATKLD